LLLAAKERTDNDDEGVITRITCGIAKRCRSVGSFKQLECRGVTTGLWVLVQQILDFFLIQSRDAVKWKPSIPPGLRPVISLKRLVTSLQVSTPGRGLDLPGEGG